MNSIDSIANQVVVAFLAGSNNCRTTPGSRLGGQVKPIDEAYQKQLQKLAQRAFDHWVSSSSSWSGSDRVDGWLSYYVNLFYQAVAEGTPRRVTFEQIERKWRAFAKEQNKKVDSARKMKRGPMSGASSTHYLFFGEDRFADSIPHLFRMTRPDE